MPSPLYLCLHLCDFAAQALAVALVAPRAGSTLTGHPRAVAVLAGAPPLERVFAMNQEARRLGLVPGMSRLQAESFPVLVLRRDRQLEDISFAELMGCAGRFSPRVETIAAPREESCGATLLLDVSGSERLLGSAQQIAVSLHRAVSGLGCESSGYEFNAAAGYEASVAAAHNACAALLAARGLPGVTAIAPGREAETLAPLAPSVLEPDAAQAQTLAAWGIHTLGQLAALPTRALAARLGQGGLRLQAQARGEYNHLLRPTEEPPDALLCEAVELEHPVELLEPLLFLLSHMLERVLQRAAQRALAIAAVETCLVLEGNALDGASNPAARPEHRRPEHRRTVRPALAERDRPTLLKLLQLDLEMHPPPGAVVALRIVAHPARPQTAQQGLFTAQAPEAGRMEILLARLRKLVGEERVGAPELLDTHAPESFRVAGFAVDQASLPGVARRPPPMAAASATSPPTMPAGHAPALRIVRPPCAVAIELRGDAPVAMDYEGQRRPLQARSGPWRSSGAWWTNPAWCREEWDVALEEEPRRCLRLAYEPGADGYAAAGATLAARNGCWYVIGIYD